MRASSGWETAARLSAMDAGPTSSSSSPWARPMRLFAQEPGCMDEQQITIWDVGASAPLFPPMLTTDDGGGGAVGLVDGRLTAAHGVDARKNDDRGEGVWEEEMGDLYLRGLSTGEPGAGFRPDAGFNNQLVFARACG